MVAKASAITTGLPNTNFAVYNQNCCYCNSASFRLALNQTSPLFQSEAEGREPDTVWQILYFLFVVSLTSVMFHQMKVRLS